MSMSQSVVATSDSFTRARLTGEGLDGGNDGLEAGLTVDERGQDQDDSFGRAHRPTEAIDQDLLAAPLDDGVDGPPE